MPKLCPKHKVPMRPVFHHTKFSDHTDYQCPQCFNIICPELSPKRTLRAAGVYVSPHWHGDKKLEKLMVKEAIPF